MPLLFTRDINGGLLGLWEITETEQELFTMCALPGAQETARSYQSPARRREYLASRHLVAYLQQQAGLAPAPLLSNAQGMPYFQNAAAHASLSHSGNYAAAILCQNMPCGVDVAEYRPSILHILNRYLFEEEIKKVDGNLQLATLYWSIKETVYKLYNKRNLQINEQMKITQLQDFGETNEGRADVLLYLPGYEQHFSVSYVQAPDFILSWGTLKQNVSFRN